MTTSPFYIEENDFYFAKLHIIFFSVIMFNISFFHYYSIFLYVM